MKTLPTASPILVAEPRLEQSRRQLREQLYQARSALTHPLTLFIAPAAGTLLAILLRRGKAPAAVSSSTNVVSSPVQSLLFALLIHFIVQFVTKRNTRDESG